jgi:PAS domain S-box-containing protein
MTLGEADCWGVNKEMAERKQFDVPIDATLRRRVTGGLAAAVVLTVFLSFSLWLSARRAEQDAYWVSHTHEVMATIQGTFKDVTEAVRSARAFALSGQEPLLAHHRTARETIYQEEDALRQLMADNLSQQRRLEVLGPQVRTALAFGDSIIAKRRKLGAYPGGRDALEIETLIDDVRATTRDMQAEETRLLTQRTQRAAAGQRLTKITAVAGVFLEVGLWVLVFLVVIREIGASARARSQLNTLNIELEKRVEERTAALQSEIADRRRAQEVAERLAAVVQSSDDAIISKTLDGTITAWNRGAEKVFGYSGEEAVGKPMALLLPPERADEESGILERVSRGESVHHFDTVRVRKDGKKIDVSVTISPVVDSTGRIVGASKIARNITERKLKEEQLRASEDRFRLFIEHAPAALAMFDREMRYLQVSRRWRTDYGLGERELHGVSHYEIFPEVPQRWKEIHRRGLAGEVLRAEDDRLDRSDGSAQWIRWEVRPWHDRTGEIAGIVIFSEEITERKRAEQGLRDSEEKLRLALDGAQLGTWEWDLKTGKLAGSPLSFALFGLSADADFNFGMFLSMIHPDDRARVDEAMKRTLADHSEYNVEYRVVWPDGSNRWIAAKGRAYQNDAGENFRVGGILFDVTERRQALAALREEEERFQAIANGIPQLAHMAGPDGAFSWYNQRWYEYTGTTPEQMEGWGWRSVIDSAMLPKVMERWQASIATGEPFDMEFPLRGADGTFRTFLNRVVPLKDSEGRVVRWFGTNTDISEHKEAQELLAAQAQELSVSREALEAQTRMFELVLDSMGEGLIAADRDGHFLIWNDSAKKLMGRDASDLPTEKWTPYYEVFLSDGITPCPPDRLPLVRALHGESVQVEMMVQQPGSAEGVFLEVSARPLKDDLGNLGGGVAVLRDITERKTAEREVRALNQTLETRVIERTTELKAANQELEAFTYSVSHDLRAPIRHISGFTKILVEKFRSSLPAEAQGHLQLIGQAAGRMGQMVDEMLKLARLGRQALTVKVTGLSSLVEDVITLLAPETEGRQVEWKIGQLPFVECDPVLMPQVFQNLISNALKYSRPRSPAVIEIGQTEKEGERVIFVKDNGVGFDMKYSDKLFGVFQRLHVAEEFEGNGIGLATVERIIKKHGGRVWVEAELDRGATFYFTLGGWEHSVPERAIAVAGGSL